MKKIYLLILLISTVGFSQMAVVDVKAGTQLAQQLKEVHKQTKSAEESLNLIKEQKSRLEKISDGVQSLKLVSSLINKNIQLATRIQSDSDRLSRSKFLKDNELRTIKHNYINILAVLSENLDFVNKITQSGFFNADDGTRITLLEKQKEKLNDQKALFNVLSTQYDQAIEYREFQEKWGGKWDF